MLPRQSLYDPVEKKWSGRIVKELFNPKITLGEVIRFSLLSDPKKIVQISVADGVPLTNHDILLRSFKIGCFIKRLDLVQGDVAGLIARNTENLAPLVFGLMFCGITINPLDTSFSRDEIVNLFQNSKPKIVFCDSDVYPTVAESLKILKNDAKVFILRGEFGQSVETVLGIMKAISDEDAAEFEPSDPEDGQNHTALILCSSGTTGSHKGVCLSHAAMLPAIHILDFKHHDIVFSFSSLYWVTGWMVLLYGTISGATRIITDEPFTPALFLRLIEQYKISRIISPPAQLAIILVSPDIQGCNLSSVDQYMCGGSFVSQTMVDKMQSHLPNGHLVVGYGMTETGSPVACNRNPSKRGSIGRLENNIELKILNDAGNTVAPNQNGELYIRPPYCFSRYSGQQSKDTATILQADGWIRTGDIGRIDKEGFLFYVDRKKDIMKYWNFHISPSEIEDFLMRIPAVAQVSVCGIPDLIATDLPAALIVKKDNVKLSEDDVHDFVRKNLSNHKHLRGGVYFVDKLPAVASWKVMRRKVQECAIRFYNERNKC